MGKVFGGVGEGGGGIAALRWCAAARGNSRTPTNAQSFGPGDIIAEVETDKATVDFEAQDEAVLAKM